MEENENFTTNEDQPKKTFNFGSFKKPNKIIKLPGGFMKNTVITVVGILLLVLVYLISGSFYRVDEQETAVVTMFGKHVRTDTAGLYFKIPLLQKVEKVDTTIHGTGIR